MSGVSIKYNGVTKASMTASGTKTAKTGGKYCPYDVVVEYDAPSGPASAPDNDVIYIDYDGTILYSYSASEFAELTEHPANPDHTDMGLSAQGWNWTFSAAKLYVQQSGSLVIGQQYTTTSGATEVDIELVNPARLSPKLGLKFPALSSVTVDWGDGGAVETWENPASTPGTLRKQHDYATTGKYTIKITPQNDAEIEIVGSSYYGTQLLTAGGTQQLDYAYMSAIRAVRFGAHMTATGTYALGRAIGLRYVTADTGDINVGASCFEDCIALKSFTLPKSSTINTFLCRNCSSLIYLALPSMTYTQGYLSQGAPLLRRINLPVDAGANNNSDGRSLQRIVFHSNTTAIGNAAANKCYTLGSVVIPASVTSIGSNAFGSCYSMKEVHLKPTAPPTLASTNAFDGKPTDIVFYVPYSEDHSVLTAYKTTTNWSSFASYMQEEPAS